MSEKSSLIIGLGISGLSCIEYLSSKGQAFRVIDTRPEPANLNQVKAKYPQLVLHLGGYNFDWLSDTREIIVSPGLSQDHDFFRQARAQHIPIIGDIELFARNVNPEIPVCAITGSNGKSTVTSLVFEMAKHAGKRVLCGGNIGIPALDLLAQPEPELYVLELSSFQLETTTNLKLKAATILNINPNHLDRYESLEHYAQAKQRIFLQAENIICNRDDARSFPHNPSPIRYFYGCESPASNEFGLIQQSDGPYLAFGNEPLLKATDMKIKGRHNYANALAALALGTALDLPMPAMLRALKEFGGLPHRCQWIGETDQVTWYNDSKATNVAATTAAICGLGAEMHGKLIVLMGGQDKGDDFSLLCPWLQKYVRCVITFGQDAAKIEAGLGQNFPYVRAPSDLKSVIELAISRAFPGDAVLLSPACASFDMFKNFEHRGEVFIHLVKQRLGLS